MKKLVIPFLIAISQLALSQKLGKNDTFEVRYQYWHNQSCPDEVRRWTINSFISTNKWGPLLPCYLLKASYITCDDPVPLYGVGQTGPQPPNNSYHNEGKCLKMGGFRAEDIEFTNVKCKVLNCVECYGPRTFTKLTPCIIYTGHYFLTTLLYSIFLGLVAVDRFCLGYSAMAVGKLMTLGGFGVWWIVDIFLLVLGYLGPADDSNWEPMY